MPRRIGEGTIQPPPRAPSYRDIVPVRTDTEIIRGPNRVTGRPEVMVQTRPTYRRRNGRKQ